MSIDAKVLRIQSLAGQPWALRESVFDAGVSMIRRVMAGEARGAVAAAGLRGRAVADTHGQGAVLNVASLIQSGVGEVQAGQYAVVDRVALVPVSGILMRYRADVTDSEGGQFGTAYEDVVSSVELAMADRGVSGVLMVIDSPGGLATPAADAFSRLRDARAKHKKPLLALGVDAVYSAGLYLAASADRFFIMPMAGVGAIGSILMVPNKVNALAAEGITVEVFKTRGGEAKDAGNPYREMTDPDRAQLQASVDSLGYRFFDDMAMGRGVTRETVLGWAARTERHGPEVVEAGIADGIVTNLSEAIAAVLDESAMATAAPLTAAPDTAPPAAVPATAVSSSLTTYAGKAPAKGSAVMTLAELLKSEGGAALVESIKAEAVKSLALPAQPATPQAGPATPSELKAAYPDDPSFVLDCVEKGLSMLEAKAARADVLAAKLKEENAARVAAEAKSSQAEKSLADRQAVVSKLAAAGVTAGHKGVSFAPEGSAAASLTGMSAGPIAQTENEREFLSLVASIKSASKCDEFKARGLAARQNPELHRKYLEDSGAGLKAHAKRIGAVGRPALGV